LGLKFQNLPNGNLVGMEPRVEELEKCLALESVSDLRVVGISGMGGIGKTTLALALYKKIAHQYDVHCFVDVENSDRGQSSSLGVQKDLLQQCLNGENLEIWGVFRGTYMSSSRLRNKRGLIVLDNIDQDEQQCMFTLLRECLGGGSTLIIISRNEHILRTLGVHHVYQVQPLNQYNAVHLFYKNAFKCDHIMSGWQNIFIPRIVSYAQGHPLAIEVIGKSLVGGDMVKYWIWIIRMVMLHENKSVNIMDVLQIIYDDLEEKEKEVFLHIACFFGQNASEHYVKGILGFRGFNPEIDLKVLVDKSLITISCGMISMPNLLRDLGNGIREKSHKEPRKWSRFRDWEVDALSKLKNLNLSIVEVEEDLKLLVHGKFDKVEKGLEDLELFMHDQIDEVEEKFELCASNIKDSWNSFLDNF